MGMEIPRELPKLQFWQSSRLPLVLQSATAECGLACLSMVAGFHGKNLDLQTMRQQFQLSESGMTLIDLLKVAERQQLSGRPLSIELNEIKYVQTPCILHWDLNHFVVLKKIRRNGIVIHDPARGECDLSYSEASKHFTGVALELTPVQGFKAHKVAAPKLKLSSLWSSISGLKQSLLLIFTLSLLLQCFVLAAPYYIQLVIDDVIYSSDTGLLPVLAIGFFLVLMFEIVTKLLRGFTLLQFGNLMNLQLGANLFHHLVRLPLNYFQTRHMGDIVSRFGSLQQIRELLTTGVIEALIDGLMALITILVIFMYSSKLALVVIVSTTLYALFRLFFYRQFRRASEQEIRASAAENSNFMETVRGIQTVKICGAELLRESGWQNHYAESLNKSIKLGNFRLSFEATNRFLFGVENLLVIYLAAMMIIEGGFSTGMLFAFIAYKGQFVQKASNLIERFIEFKMIGLHLERIADIALTPKEPLDSEVERCKHIIKGKIELQNITFAYSDATENVVENLSLSIAPGESVAITGVSGCGKSTLMKIMLGLLEPQQGKMLVDDLSVGQLGRSHYRSQVAAVMQEDTMFSGTIIDNIALFAQQVDIDRVENAARLADIHADIMAMPMAYQSLIGDMGASLSGGQKQRIILARALYRQPRILFMDEATSHLDLISEVKINRAIKALDITRVIIAHRKETITSADREIVIG